MRRQKPKKRNLTLIEIIIVVIIVGIITTLAVPGYNNLIENSKAKVCETNLNVLLGALEVYALENDELPGSLGRLPSEHLRKGWAKVFEKENQLMLKLAYFLVDFDRKGAAYAQTAWVGRYIGDLKYFECPSDPTPPPAGRSYGLNVTLANISYSAYKVLASDTDIIADSDAETFSAPSALRHAVYSVGGGKSVYAQKIDKSGDVSGKDDAVPTGKPTGPQSHGDCISACMDAYQDCMGQCPHGHGGRSCRDACHAEKLACKAQCP